MTVIVANDTPPAIRGMLKRWFIEPRPNVFVGTVNKKMREKVIEYVRRNAVALDELNLGLLIITSDNTSQGFEIMTFGETPRKETVYSGLYLIAEQWNEGSLTTEYCGPEGI